MITAAISGPLLALMLVLTMLSAGNGGFLLVAAALAWLSAVLLWTRLTLNLKRQVFCLLLLGGGGISWGWSQGVAIDWVRVTSQNQLIISMLAAVSLLRLLNFSDQGQTSQSEHGGAAFVRGILGLQLFAAVINISAMVIMADRLSRQHPLRFFEALSMSRSFTMAVFYSPFIGGMALALAYTPGSSLPTIMFAGLSLALMGLVSVLTFSHWFSRPSIDAFRGYPIKWESLWLPGLLASTVILVHQFTEGFSILLLIIILTPLISLLVTLIRSGPREGTYRIREFVTHRLPDLSGEIALFLSAGVLAAGLFAVFSALDVHFFAVFDAVAAAQILVVAVLLACTGIHPIVVVSTVVPLLSPLDPAPNLLAFLCVCCWGIGCAVCPLSGTNITLRSRYGISNWRIGVQNIPYALLMTGFAIGLFFIYESLLLA